VKRFLSWSRCLLLQEAPEKIVPVLKHIHTRHHQPTIFTLPGTVVWKAPPTLTKFFEATYRSFIRELCSWTFVRIPRGNDNGAFYNKRYHDVAACDTMLLAAHSRCSLTTLFSSFIARMHHFISRLKIRMGQRKGPRFRGINEPSDSRFQRQIRNLPKATRIKAAASCSL
jgi:hypothetical protein